MAESRPTAAGGSWRRMLEATPVPNQAARVERHADGLAIVVPNRKPGRRIPPLCWMVRPPKERRLNLDPLGRSVWELCDGVRTVEQVVDGFADAHALEFHEARVSVTGYLKLLIQRGALAIRLP